MHIEENAFDNAINRMEKRDAWMTQLESAVQALNPIASAIEACENDVLLEQDAGIGTAISSVASAIGEIIPESAIGNMASALGTAADVMDSYHNIEEYSEICEALGEAMKTSELFDFQAQLENSIQTMGTGISAISEYMEYLSMRWENAFETADVLARSIAAQEFAVVRLFPEYEKLDLPRGSKRVLKSLTKDTAKELTQTDKILFDPKKGDFCHKDSPEKRLTGNQMTMLERAQALFKELSFDELVAFESQLSENQPFAVMRPVGQKIFDIIKRYVDLGGLIDFDSTTYYHARKLEEGQNPFLDDEMLKAPRNVSGHGRYNPIGKSCYYIAENEAGAVNEIKKHCGGVKTRIQVVGMKAVRAAKLLDLSLEIEGSLFLEHLRLSVENEQGREVKEYLLPNFVAACCRELEIDGIKYKSGSYNCVVLWEDGYFKFEGGTRKII